MPIINIKSFAIGTDKNQGRNLMIRRKAFLKPICLSKATQKITGYGSERMTDDEMVYSKGLSNIHRTARKSVYNSHD